MNGGAMTHQQILWAIDQAALQAADSAFDAFGSDPAVALPTPEMAWDFLNENVYGDGEVERPAALPEFLTRQFKHDYRRHLQVLVQNRARVVA
jgi:hypothetical protein